MPLNKHILIVEDDDQISRMYEKILQHHNFRTLRLSNVWDAIDNLARFDPDVICLDWQLDDGTTGDMFLDYISQLNRVHLPQIIIISANVHPGQLQHYQHMIADTMQKPISVNHFVKKIQAIAEKSNGRQPLQNIEHHILAEGVIHIRWEGHITSQLIRTSMQAALYEADTVIFDIQRMNLTRFRMDDLPHPVHRPLPNLKRIFVVCDPGDQATASYVLKYLNTEIIACYYDKLDAAIASALS